MSHSKKAEVPSDRIAPREALEVARYVTDMTAQLEAMAVAARLDFWPTFSAWPGGKRLVHSRQCPSSWFKSRIGELGHVDTEADNDNPLD